VRDRLLRQTPASRRRARVFGSVRRSYCRTFSSPSTIEQLIRNQWVGGSTPLNSTIRPCSQRYGIITCPSGSHDCPLSVPLAGADRCVDDPETTSLFVRSVVPLRRPVSLACRAVSQVRGPAHTGPCSVLVDYRLSGLDRGRGAYGPTWVRIAANALRLSPAAFSQARQITSVQDVAVPKGD
jgi:hypothetical protein